MVVCFVFPDNKGNNLYGGKDKSYIKYSDTSLFSVMT